MAIPGMMHAPGMIPVFGTQAPVTSYMQVFEHVPTRMGISGGKDVTNGSMSIYAANFPMNISWKNVIFYATTPIARNLTASFAIYSLTDGTLTLLNSASASTNLNGSSYISMVTSATSDYPPGTYYFAYNFSRTAGFLLKGNRDTINPTNAVPGLFLAGRATATTNAFPASIATTNLDITGSDASIIPYTIITA